MSDIKHSIIEYFSEQSKSQCNYCYTNEGSYTYGLNAYSLRVEDYQDMIDRGWRRCGKYCYKSVMDRSCCPLYTIRCGAKDFKLSKTQKKILKKFNNFLLTGTITQDKKIFKNADIAQPMEIYSLEGNHKKEETKSENIDFSGVNVSLSEKPQPLEGEGIDLSGGEKQTVVTKPVEKNTSDSKCLQTKNKCMKAKYLRIERKKQKLQNLGFSGEELEKKMVEKKRYPVIKTIEDYINETSSKQRVHNLKISLVRSCPRSEEFDKTFDVSFDLYKRYQVFIHKDPAQKLTQHQFERFLVVSPLQIQLILVNSPEFEKSFTESALLFAKYQKLVHHESDEDCDIESFTNFLVDSPLKASKGFGSYHQQYWLDDKLIAVGVIDILPKCVSSVYFFYDPELCNLSLGTYGALREIEFTRKLSSRFPGLDYYYMGFYIHSCVKMKYKGAFQPSYLLCPEVYTWHPIKECLPKLNASKYSRLNEDIDAVDTESNVTVREVLILHNRTAMNLHYYLRTKKCNSEEREEIMEYAKLIGKSCAKNMLLFRM